MGRGRPPLDFQGFQSFLLGSPAVIGSFFLSREIWFVRSLFIYLFFCIVQVVHRYQEVAGAHRNGQTGNVHPHTCQNHGLLFGKRTQERNTVKPLLKSQLLATSKMRFSKKMCVFWRCNSAIWRQKSVRWKSYQIANPFFFLFFFSKMKEKPAPYCT